MSMKTKAVGNPEVLWSACFFFKQGVPRKILKTTFRGGKTYE